LLKKAMTFNAASEVRDYVENYMRHKFPEEFEKVED
jgi:hypothetical protein